MFGNQEKTLERESLGKNGKKVNLNVDVRRPGDLPSNEKKEFNGSIGTVTYGNSGRSRRKPIEWKSPN